MLGIGLGPASNTIPLVFFQDLTRNNETNAAIRRPARTGNHLLLASRVYPGSPVRRDRREALD
jgi:hypothetical protein